METGEVRAHEAAIRALQQAPPELLAGIIAMAPLGIGIVDDRQRTIITNDALRHMLGYTAEQFAQLPFAAFTHAGDVARNEELFSRLMAGETDRFQMDKRFIHRDGHVVWGRLVVSRIAGTDGAPLAVGMVQDVTEEKRLQAELAAAEETYRLLVERVPAVVYSGPAALSESANYLSPQLDDLLGFSPEEWASSPGVWLERIHEDDVPGVLARYQPLLEGGEADPVSLTYRMYRRDGRIIWVRDEFSLTLEDGELIQRGVVVDVTREKELEAELEHLAFHDPLTQLANLRLFRLRVDDRLARRSPVAGAVLFADLDGFKEVNDTLGHALGDELLQEAASRITGCLRPADTAARLGGDEFAVLVDEVADRDQACQIAERVAAALERRYRLGPEALTVDGSSSIGVAMLVDGTDADTVLRAADLAMYEAKDAGKGRVTAYEPAMLAAALERVGLTQRRATG